VPGHPVGELLAVAIGEVGDERRLDGGVVGKVRRDDLVDQVHLGVGQQHRQLGLGEPPAAGLPLGQLLVVGEGLDGPRQPAVVFE
jgi:hypothetical protein